MNAGCARLKSELEHLFENLETQNFFDGVDTLVIGCSTSEVMGKRIGSDSSMDAAEVIFNAFQVISDKHQLNLIFQGCEHINRALTTEKSTAEKFGFEMVSVVPDKKAGGSLSEYAYRHLSDPAVVEHVTADAGIDIGQTLIGMHIRHVAVPVRSSVKTIGSAYVTIAKSRPKLIGGPRAVYE